MQAQLKVDLRNGNDENITKQSKECQCNLLIIAVNGGLVPSKTEWKDELDRLFQQLKLGITAKIRRSSNL